MQPNEQIKSLRMMTRGAYDLQQLRIQAGLRLCSNFRAKLGLIGQTEESDEADEIAATLDEGEDGKERAKEAKKILDLLRAEYKMLTTGISKNRELPTRKGFKGAELISDYAELLLVNQYERLVIDEKKAFGQLLDVMEQIPVWTEWLSHQTGIGPAMGAVLITSFDPHKAVYPSCFLSLSGVACSPKDGMGMSRRKEHLIEREYVAKDGTTKTKLSTVFDPWLQARLLAVLGPCMMRANSPYRKFYDEYKHRIQTDPQRLKMTDAAKSKLRLAGEDVRNIWPPSRIHRAAIRYMLKIFLINFWREWRELENLPLAPSYWEAKRGYEHGTHEPIPSA